MDYELEELVQQAFDKYLLTKIEALMDKHLPIIDARIKERIEGDRYSTPELNVIFSKRVESLVENAVGNFIRVGANDINGMICKAYEKQIDGIVEGKVQAYIARKTSKVLEALGQPAK